MKKRLAAVIMLFVLLLTCCASAEHKSFAFMDSGEEIAAFKQVLVSIGYLDSSNNTSDTYDRFTKTAVETLQGDFDLEVTGIATPEIRVICDLLYKLQTSQSASAPAPTSTPEPTSIPLPDVKGLYREEGRALLESYGFFVIEREEFSSNVAENMIISCTRDKNDERRTIIVVSKGPMRLYANQSTVRWWNIQGSNKDNYELTNPFIDREEGILFIELDATFNSYNPHKFRGYGTASITDVFDKCVPINVKYEKETITQGETQHIVLEIPINDLNIERPTTICVQIELYTGWNLDVEEALRLDFTMTW